MPLIAIDGAEIFCDVTGPAGAPAVLFSNSLGTTLEMWDRQARALAGRYRVIRGGSWSDTETRLLTVYYRNFTAPDTAQPTIGFRCVRPAGTSAR